MNDYEQLSKFYILYALFNLITYDIISYMMRQKKENLVYDIEDIKKTGNIFKEKLHALIELSEYGSGKLGVYNDELYISWNWFQSIQRTIYGESREKLIDFLKNVFDEYDIYVKMINTCINYNHHRDTVYGIKEEHYILINKWFDGIKILEEQYQDDIDFVEELKKIRIKHSIPIYT